LTHPNPPTLKDIEVLCAYLPRLYATGFKPVTRWEGGTKNSQGHIQMPYPVYDPLVNEFFRVVAQDCWIDRGYNSGESASMLARIESLSMSELRSVLTYCLRGERFSDGHWGEMIEKGHIRRILERLEKFVLPPP
jgi:hypothetical protein